MLYVGGHLSVEDYDKLSNLKTFFNAVTREVKEELNFDLKTESICLGVIGTYTPETEKSKNHMGIVFTVEIEKTLKLNLLTENANLSTITTSKTSII